MLTYYLIGGTLTTIVFAIDGALDKSVEPIWVAIISVIAGIFWPLTAPAYLLNLFVKGIRRITT